MIQGAFAREDRARAIGAWTGLTSVAAALGAVRRRRPAYASWRWIFLINLPLALLTVVVAQQAVPETLDPNAPRRFDAIGAVLAVLTLGGLTYALIQVGWRAGAVGGAGLRARRRGLRRRRAPQRPPRSPGHLRRPDVPARPTR